MPIQRYDVPSIAEPETFIFKVWAPTNSPLHDGSHRDVVGGLHNVRDVTTAFQAIPEEPGTIRTDAPATADDHLGLVNLSAELRAALRHERQVAADLLKRSQELEAALESNREIGIAIGILMFARKITAPDAFELLRRVSARDRRKLRQVATDVVAQGCIAI